MTDVVFFTNRAMVGDPLDWRAYSGKLGDGLLTGVAQVTGAPTDKRKAGRIAAIAETGSGALHKDAATRLARADHVYFFVHGFDNSFHDAITRAACNRDWFARMGGPAGSALAVTLSWPSPGKAIGPGQSDKWKAFWLTGAYKADQERARASGAFLLKSLALARQAMGKKKGSGRKFFLMAHSMGHEVVARALAIPGAAADTWIDDIFLCAGDVDATTSVPDWIKAARAGSGRVHVYFSQKDNVLDTSANPLVNGCARLGQSGTCGLPHDAALTPGMRFVDCTATKELDLDAIEGNSGHYYYRRVDEVCADIANAMAGGGEDGPSALPVPKAVMPVPPVADGGGP